MLNSDKKAFYELMKSAMAIYGKEFNGEVMPIWWAALNEYSLEEVSAAMSTHTKSSEFAPVPASIIKHMPDKSGWLSPDEAWAALPKTDYDGGYITQEMASATPYDLIDSGDMIAARMAFIAAYKRAVVNAQGKKPEYFYSAPNAGSYMDKQVIKEQSLLIAKEKQWISPTTYQKYALELDRPISQDNPVLKLARQTASGSKRIESE